jgi:phosphoglucomutase
MPPREQAAGLVDEWLKLDFNHSTRKTVSQWLIDGNFIEIESRLSGKHKLVFGTAGLRAPMGPGYDRMNTVTVMQTTQGLVEYLLTQTSTPRSVVIGFDGRHNSESFAHVVAAVFLAKKFTVHFIEKPSPTPFTPYLIPKLGAACGI